MLLCKHFREMCSNYNWCMLVITVYKLCTRWNIGLQWQSVSQVLRFVIFFLLIYNNSTLHSSGWCLAKTAMFSRIITLFIGINTFSVAGYPLRQKHYFARIIIVVCLNDDNGLTFRSDGFSRRMPMHSNKCQFSRNILHV